MKLKSLAVKNVIEIKSRPIFCLNLHISLHFGSPKPWPFSFRLNVWITFLLCCRFGSEAWPTIATAHCPLPRLSIRLYFSTANGLYGNSSRMELDRALSGRQHRGGRDPREVGGYPQGRELEGREWCKKLRSKKGLCDRTQHIPIQETVFSFAWFGYVN